jgi:hypothetical protein
MDEYGRSPFGEGVLATANNESSNPGDKSSVMKSPRLGMIDETLPVGGNPDK